MLRSSYGNAALQDFDTPSYGRVSKSHPAGSHNSGHLAQVHYLHQSHHLLQGVDGPIVITTAARLITITMSIEKQNPYHLRMSEERT